MTHYEIFGDFADFRARFRGFHENISFLCSNTVNSVRQVTQTCRVVAILRNSNASPPARFSVTGTFTHTEDTPLSLKRTNIDGDAHRPHPHIPLQKQVSPILAVAHETERNRDTHVTPRAYDTPRTPRGHTQRWGATSWPLPAPMKSFAMPQAEARCLFQTKRPQRGSSACRVATYSRTRSISRANSGVHVSGLRRSIHTPH